MNGGGGVGAAKISLRLQYYVLLAGVGAVLLVACLKYMPAAAVVAAGYGSWGSGLAVATRAAEAEAASSKRSPVVIFNFGDSNSDTGGMAAASGLNIALPEGRTYFRRPTGRLSDGRLVIDFICESLGTPHLSPYLKALGSDFSNGANFAIGGSTATPGGSPFSLDVQLHQFLYFRTRSFELLNKGERTPIDRDGFRNAIYAMDIGHNDLSAYLHLPYDQVLAKIPAIVGHIKFGMETLYAHGARKFWIHGTGALGCLPQKLSIPRDDDSDLDGNGCLNKYNNVAKAFNAKLAETCNQLRQRMADAAIVFTDLYAIKYDLVANHTKYGIERPLMACCGNGGPPHNYNHFKMCMSGEMQLCDMDARFISWDGVHLRLCSVKPNPARFWVQSTRVRRDFPRRGINPAHPDFSVRLSPVCYFPGPNLSKPTRKKSSPGTPWKESPSEALVSSLPSEATEAVTAAAAAQPTRRRRAPPWFDDLPRSPAGTLASECPIYPAAPLPRPEP